MQVRAPGDRAIATACRSRDPSDIRDLRACGSSAPVLSRLSAFVAPDRPSGTSRETPGGGPGHDRMTTWNRRETPQGCSALADCRHRRVFAHPRTARLRRKRIVFSHSDSLPHRGQKRFHPRAARTLRVPVPCRAQTIRCKHPTQPTRPVSSSPRPPRKEGTRRSETPRSRKRGQPACGRRRSGAVRHVQDSEREGPLD